MDALAMVAPGTPLRDGLDRVLQADLGALVVVGDQPAVLSVCTGGFLLDAEFSPQRLSELAKMDGAIILAPDASRIARANVHLVPKASIHTSETGTRHRTAERVARSIDVPVIAVSEAMSTIAVYRNDRKRTLEPTGRLVDRSNQALRALARFKSRFDQAVASLSTLEIEDTVSVRDVVEVLQPGEMMVRIGEEIDDSLVELGEDGRMFRLQREELSAGVGETLRLVMRDYVADGSSGHGGVQPDGPRARRAPSADERDRKVARALAALHDLEPEGLLDPNKIAETLGQDELPESLDAGLECRGYRLLHRVPRMSDVVIDRIVDRFATLPGIMQASLGELEKVGGVGTVKARSVKDGLARMAEASILERYD
jgi:diadenylate cyclase